MFTYSNILFSAVTSEALVHTPEARMLDIGHIDVGCKLRVAYMCAYRPCCAVRTAKFVARKQWVVCGADDMYVRVFNYNTMDKVKQFEAHTDYIRCAAGPGKLESVCHTGTVAQQARRARS